MGTTIAFAVLAPIVLPMAGFTSAGIAAASFAASIQGPAVVTGSYFAIAQSIGASGAAACATAGVKVGLVAGVSGAATGAAGLFTWMASNRAFKKFRKLN